MIKLIIWGVIGYFLYHYFRNKFMLTDGGKRDGASHQQFREEKKDSKNADEEYIDYEELK